MRQAQWMAKKYMDFLYPPIEPFDTGLLEVDKGVFIYWEVSGNPNGIPVLYLHGGPGSGLKTGYRRRYDPEKYLIISFEQRGCGRSLPLIIDSLDRIQEFNTSNFIADIEKLRQHLDISSWLVTGISWGTTLALAYAQAHPSRVQALVLAAINLATSAEVKWITEDMKVIFPEEWEVFQRAAQAMPDESLIDAYYRAILSKDAEVRFSAYKAWSRWESAHVSIDPMAMPNPSFEDEEFRAVFSTQVIHFWKHAAFLSETHILENMSKLQGIPGVLIHGRLDVSSPVKTAWDLNKAWDAGRLIVIEDEGHGGPKIIGAFVDAVKELTPRFE
ncbi:putative proline iminopeptidase [Vibrio rotiferianus]|uniref:prolyl aminopeptidase n=1 Tax=Vibrio rotiferianus TaxID=190895 RepID=UPI0028947EC1|nr:putative proline iminopeptidase [Vibrio rotiferianus]